MTSLTVKMKTYSKLLARLLFGMLLVYLFATLKGSSGLILPFLVAF